MTRPLRTAFLAVSLGLCSSGFANADVLVRAHTLAAERIIAAGDAVVSVEAAAAAAATQTAPVPQPLPPVLLEQAQQSDMPSPGADLTMWSPGKSGASAMSGAKDRSAIQRFARGIVRRTSAMARNLTRNAMRYIGTPYVFGGTSPSGFDCSGYVQHVFALLGIPLPRTADEQFYAGRRAIGGITTGDLVFFQTYLPGPSHVGIYIGRGKFIHSSGHGVMVSRLRDRYWSARYLGAKRVVASR